MAKYNISDMAGRSMMDLAKEDPPELTPQKMKEWNQLLDFIKTKGYEGSTKLDKDKALSQQLFNEFKKANPQTSITYDIVPVVQREMEKLKQSAQGFAARRDDPNAKNIMSNISKVDGFLGSKTSQFRFPAMQEVVKHNDVTVQNKNLGLVKGDLTPVGPGGINLLRTPPKGAKIEKLKGGDFYTDENGDLRRIIK